MRDWLVEATLHTREENVSFNNNSKTKQDWIASWKNKGKSFLHSILIPFWEGNYLSPDQISYYEKLPDNLLMTVQRKT